MRCAPARARPAGRGRSRHGQSRTAPRRASSSTSWWRPRATPAITAIPRRAAFPACARRSSRRYKTNYDVDLDPENEAIVTIGAKDALAHLLFAVIGPATPSFRRTLLIPSINTASSWPKATPACFPCPDPADVPQPPGGSLPHLHAQAQACFSSPSRTTPPPRAWTWISSERSSRLARHHGTMVVHDFAYADLGFDGYQAAQHSAGGRRQRSRRRNFLHVQELQHGRLARRLLPGQSAA